MYNLSFPEKTHPADVPGQEVLATILKYTRHPDFYGKVIFLPNYDAAIGRYLTQGCDVWLNNPRRPREASGTSGQKASLNGNLNLSILDGWWPEGFDGKNGWGIDVNHKDREWKDLEEQDETDANAPYMNYWKKRSFQHLNNPKMDRNDEAYMDNVYSCI